MLETSDGDWYMPYLARRNINGSSPLGRETFIASVTWHDGWPTVNDGKPVLLSDFVDGLPTKDKPNEVSHHFQGDLQAKGWYNLRTPYVPVYSQGSRAGCGFSAEMERRMDAMADNTSDSGLILCPNVYTLSDRDVPAAILRKQTSLNMTFSARTLGLPQELPDRGAIGISAYLSESVHHDIGVSNCANSTGLCVYTLLYRNGTEQRHEVNLDLGEDRQVDLIIRAEPQQYSLGYSDGSSLQFLTQFSSYWMAWAPEDTFVFEGAMFALFATGHGLPWTTAGPTVGFETAYETFYAEDLSDFDE